MHIYNYKEFLKIEREKGLIYYSPKEIRREIVHGMRDTTWLFYKRYTAVVRFEDYC